MNALRTLLLSALFFLGTVPSIADELVSFDLVRESSGSPEARMPYDASTAVRVGDRLKLVSADGHEFGLRISKTTVSPLGNRIIHASTDGGGKALIVADKAGGLLGAITELGERHQISTSTEGQRRIFKEGYSSQEKRIDDGGVPPKEDMPTSRVSLDLKEEELSSSPIRAMKAERSFGAIYPTYKTGTAKISVLMYYDDSMSNPSSKIDFITRVANNAFADSGAKIEIEIVGIKPLDIDDEASHKDLRKAMPKGEAPFEEIESDRSFFEADLVFILRETEAPDGEDPCGIGAYGVYKQIHYRSQFTGLVQWKPADGEGTYCTELTFAHEVGHILGSAHDRADITDEPYGAYTFSYGTALDGVFRTVMGVSGGSKLGLFSSPNLNCEGYPCGKPASSADSADNVSTFHGTGHLIASNEGPFAFEAISAFSVDGRGDGELEGLPFDPDRVCEDEGESSYWKALGISNQYKEPLNIAELHYVRENGAVRSYSYDKGERTVKPGSRRWYGWCDTESNAAYTDFVESFAHYYHPDTDELVETSHVYFDDDYNGQYSVVRVATSAGGKVIGHPEQYVRAGARKDFTFTPESGYEVANIQSNCSGRKSGNIYTVDVGQDNCFVEATFNQLAVGETLRLSIETPADGQVYSGIGTFQGWAVAKEGIDRVDLYVDGAFFQSAPYGGARGDVGNVFPDVPNSNNSGYALAFNYGNLSDGLHTLRAVAVTENGRTLENFSSFTVAKFHKPFIGPQDSVNLNSAFCSVQGNQMSVVDALIDGKSYDISLEWRTGTQGFEIYRIR